MSKKSSRDWNAERKDLAEAFTQLEFMKLWLQEHQQEAQRFTKEFEKLATRLIKGELDDDMVEFSVDVPRETWEGWQEALRETSDFNKTAFEALSWGMLNLIAKNKEKEARGEERDIVMQSIGPEVATSWENEIVNPSPRRTKDDGEPPIFA